MNALLLALVLTCIVVLDYLWEKFPERIAKHKTAKVIFASALLLIGWLQAGVQCHNDKQAGKQMDYLAAQLTLANTSLTNATLTIKGMNDGGDAYAEPLFAFQDATNTNLLSISLKNYGQFFLRMMSDRVENMTKRMYSQHNEPKKAAPPSELVHEGYLGDMPFHWWNGDRRLCDVTLDPTITNYVRIDLTAVNGFSWSVYSFSSATNGGWYVNLFYRYRRIQDRLEYYPTNMAGKIVVW